MTEALSIRPYDYRETGRYTESLIECYQRVFAGPPWNEQWGRESVDIILETLGGASNFIACDGDKAVGFAFGRLERATSLERELGIEFAAAIEERASFAGDLAKQLVFDPAYVLYQADLGVLPEYQGQGLAKRLFWTRYRANPQPYFVTRARQFPEPSVTYLWYTEKLGYEVVARYPEEDGRVILFQTGEALASRL